MNRTPLNIFLHTDLCYIMPYSLYNAPISFLLSPPLSLHSLTELQSLLNHGYAHLANTLIILCRYSKAVIHKWTKTCHIECFNTGISSDVYRVSPPTIYGDDVVADGCVVVVGLHPCKSNRKWSDLCDCHIDRLFRSVCIDRKVRRIPSEVLNMY